MSRALGKSKAMSNAGSPAAVPTLGNFDDVGFRGFRPCMPQAQFDSFAALAG